GNTSRFSNPDMDAALDVLKTKIQTADQIAAVKTVQQVYVDQTAEIPLYYREEARGVSTRLQNFMKNPGTASDVWNSEDWWVQQYPRSQREGHRPPVGAPRALYGHFRRRPARPRRTVASMTKFIIRRALGLIPLLFGIIVISFALMKLAPGGPERQLKQNPKVTAAQMPARVTRWCIDRESSPVSVVREFAGWFGAYNCETDSIFSEQGGLNILPAFVGGGTNGIIHGDLGISIASGRPVTQVIVERIPASLILTSVAVFLWVLY